MAENESGHIVEELRASLLSRRIAREAIVLGKAYLIHARNGGVGVAVQDGEYLGYKLHRVKFNRHYLFVEIDWHYGSPCGTAIPLTLLEAEPPREDALLLDWLAEREVEHRDAIRAAWDEVLSTGTDSCEASITKRVQESKEVNLSPCRPGTKHES